MSITGKYPNLRLRRSRKYNWSRKLVEENTLSNSDLILPIFLIEGSRKKIPIKSIKVEHGKVNSICYIFDKKLAYISDVSKIYKKDYKFFRKLKFLVIDCLWYKNHPSHLNLEKSLELIKIFSPKRAILTNLHSEIDYKILKKNFLSISFQA